ncbi:MAG: DUF1566 domain-containing protein [Candidatus Scalinduaceae bacterium]
MKSLLSCRALIKIGKMMVVVAIVAGLNVATSLSNAQGRGNPATTGGGQIPPGLEIISEQFGYAPVAKTGQTTSFATGDDGDLKKGVALPNPRFTDNGDGTITDNLTGLIWLKDANCIETKYASFDDDQLPGDEPEDGAVFWQTALDFVLGINDGTYSNCGAGFTDWRLPNIRELHSLINYGFVSPALSNTAGTGKWSNGDPFSNVGSFSVYWSSTTKSGGNGAWEVGFQAGRMNALRKQERTFHVWCVRGP